MIRIKVPRDVEQGSLAAGGDVNGDGIDDLVAGQRTMYVVFGRRYGGTISVRHLGAGGARLGRIP